MGCNCRKPRPPKPAGTVPAPQPEESGTEQSFTLRLRDGRVQRFGSKLERDAARVRYGLR